LAAYFRGGSINQPGQTEAVDHDGVSYIVMANDKGVLAFFRIREVNSVPVLRCLKCWPKEVTEAFV
jgi:hypothetical protein